MFSKKRTPQEEHVPRRRAEQHEEARTSGQFRRNQTLHQRRVTSDDDASLRSKVHELNLRRNKVGGVFLVASMAVALLAFLLTQLTAQMSFVVDSPEVTRAISPQEAQYEEAITAYFGINPAQRLRIFLDEQALSAYVSALHAEVASMSASAAPRIAETQFSISFREPVAGWQIGGEQLYVDSEGVVFERNYYAQPSVQIVDESGIPAEQGTAVASTRLLGLVGQIVSLGEGRGYTATHAILPADATRRLDMKFDGVEPRIRFSLDRGAGEQVDEMVRAIAHLQQQNKKATYVDVRVKERVVYR